MAQELPAGVHEKIKRLCKEGDALADAGELAQAISRFKQALALLPPPPHQWQAATWIFAAIGDSHYLAGAYAQARAALAEAMLCPQALENPFIWLRRGQTYFELGDRRLAEESLASALMLGGEEIFKNENPKYAAFLFTKLKPPAAGG